MNSHTEKEGKIARGIPDSSAQDKLFEWREVVFDRDHSFAQFDSDAILEDSLVELLCSLNPSTTSKTLLKSILESKWAWWPRYYYFSERGNCLPTST